MKKSKNKQILSYKTIKQKTPNKWEFYKNYIVKD